ncbi:MAG: hypothetical protein HY852_07765 [Bradyrhizobium sp.]|uniref:hypothetical protein n=1 Tax=Bradyrhizobium sp. TaxID=376 RepID=UPI0025B9EA0B|nr:hypothetical protein [Bradyrhizobium sp.]MBI5261697.1 hypothetical protein [Bradyrhizobium sp.]
MHTSNNKSLEDDARRIAIEMGDPAIDDSEWEIFFGRRFGVLEDKREAKMLFAYSAAHTVAGHAQSELEAPPRRTATMVLLALAATAVLYAPLYLYAQAGYVPGDPHILRQHFVRLDQNAWIAYFGTHARARTDTADYPARSTLQLYEDSRPLGPAHAPHREIATNGGGRYSHWFNGLETLIFSTSDNSDPNTNGRTYRAIDPEYRDPYLPGRKREAVAAK